MALVTRSMPPRTPPSSTAAVATSTSSARPMLAAPLLVNAAKNSPAACSSPARLPVSENQAYATVQPAMTQ